MKLRKRIAAAFTALALMFTLTDPAALGGIFDLVSEASAAEIIQLIIKDKLPMPEPGSLIQNSAFSVVQDSLVDEGRTDVKWYQGKPSYNISDGSANLAGKTAVTEFGYNKSYYAVVKYSPSTNNQASSNQIDFTYKLTKTNETEYKAKPWIEGSLICVVIDFSSYPTVKPKTLRDVEFSATVTGYDPTTKNEVYFTANNGHSFPSHSSLADIDSALPKKATIKTEDPDVYFEAPVVWLTKDGFTYTTSEKYDPKKVSAMDFRIQGTVSLASAAQSDQEKVHADSVSTFSVYATIHVDAAAETIAPTFATPPGTYGKDLSVKINPTGEQDVEYYYYVGKDYDEVREHEMMMDDDHLYVPNKGIQLTGTTNRKVVYYVRVISYHPDKNVCDPGLIGEFTIYVKSSSATNIPEVHIKVDPPVGGQALDVTAELDDSSGSYDDEVLEISEFGSVIWSEPGQSSSALAQFNTRYTMNVEVVPASPTYAFMRTPDVYVNGVRATGSNTGNGNFTITYTFEKTGKLTDYRAVSPGKVANVPSGTTVTQMDSSYLPKTVTVVGTKDNRISETCSVTWDLTTAITDKGTPYNPKIGTAQTVTFTGKVRVPDYMEEDSAKMTVTAQIYVEEASKVPAPWSYPPDTVEGQGTTVFNSPQDISLESAVNSATIYYNIEAYENISDISKLADPTETGGTKYIEPITLSGVPGQSLYYCIKAIATAPGMKQSDVSTFVYKVVIEKKKTQTPKPTPEPGNYASSLTITLNTETPGAKIYYTLDPNATKSSGFIEYTGPFDLKVAANSTKTFALRTYAKAPNDNWKDSDISEDLIYKITVPKEKAAVPVPSVLDTASETAITLTLSCATAKADIYYSIDTPITSTYNGILYKSGTKITLKRVDNQVVTYKLYTYAKSNDPRIDDSLVKTYTYTVGKDYGVKSIEIVKRPAKYSYYMGEKLNVVGGLIKVTYIDETKAPETVYMTESMIQDFDSWVLGQQTLTVYYQGCTAAFNIVVRRRSSSSSDSDNKPSDSGKDDGKKDDTTTDPGTSDTDKDNTTDGTVSDPTMVGSLVKGWTQLQKKIAAAAKNSRIVINLNGNTSVPADIINTAMKKKITLEFVVNDMLSWVVDTGALKKTVASLSVGLKTSDVYIPTVLIDSSGDSEIVRVHTYGKNKIGAVLYVKTGKKVNNRFANLFRYNEDSHLLDFVDTSKIISSTGVAQVVPANGGDYVLMLDTRTRLPGDADNSTTIDARDASAILKMCVGTMELDDTCDYNGDGFVNAIDSAAILRSVVGLKK